MSLKVSILVKSPCVIHRSLPPAVQGAGTRVHSLHVSGNAQCSRRNVALIIIPLTLHPQLHDSHRVHGFLCTPPAFWADPLIINDPVWISVCFSHARLQMLLFISFFFLSKQRDWSSSHISVSGRAAAVCRHCQPFMRNRDVVENDSHQQAIATIQRFLKEHEEEAPRMCTDIRMDVLSVGNTYNQSGIEFINRIKPLQTLWLLRFTSTDFSCMSIFSWCPLAFADCKLERGYLILSISVICFRSMHPLISRWFHWNLALSLKKM